ncbi:MAG: inositol 2-dehydrogenase [Rubellimicrobium sp.]|nr:inositol 2-dehydrogenase [Rubellimicrobium sp.]
MTVKFGLLGAGRIGRVHAGAIDGNPRAELVAVADALPAAAEAVAAAHGARTAAIETIIADPQIDAIAICTPTDAHADLIEAGVRAGKAVFCEKPIDLSVARVKSCLDVVRAHGGRLMIGFNRRFDPDFAAARQVVAQGRIGEVQMVTIVSRDPGPPPVDYIRRSGGIFRDMTIHDFDMARWLLGEEVETVMARASVLVDPAIGAAGDFDSVNVVLCTASGRQAVITNCRRAAYGYDQRVEILGTLGAVAAMNHHEANIELADASGYHRPPLLDFFMNRYTAAYAAEIAAFVTAVAEGGPMPTTGEDGLAALALADAALGSATEGRVVKVAEILA